MNSKWIYIALCTLSIGNHSFAQKKATSEQTIEKLLQRMTLQEKVQMIHANSSFATAGIPRLGIPPLIMSDGPHGVRVEHGNDWIVDKNVNDSGTYLPTGNTLAATWNKSLGYSFGTVLGKEAKYRGKDVILGPGINIIRTPLNGRNFEYLSEDPLLISKMVTGYIKGVQDQGISACVKHFAANNQEIQRTSINVQMSERALREIYLPGFKTAVTEAGVNTIMGAYNKFRGQWCSHNNYLLNQILKKEWGFKGIVISDWGAVHNTTEALMNGTDIEMGTDIGSPAFPYPQFYMADTVVKLVQNGQIAESIVNDKVRRILRIMNKTHMLGGKRIPGAYATKTHQQVAQKIAEEGIVLLKNERNLLPLTNTIQSIAVIGENAVRKNAMGGGSSQVKATYEITPLVGLQQQVPHNTTITYSKGYSIVRNATADTSLINEAVAAAKKADVAIIVGGWVHGYDYTKWSDNAYDAEDTDKPDMNMPFGQDALIKAVIQANPNTIVVLMGGGAIDMRQWIHQVPAIVQAWYPGMEGGTALARILLGKVNPSGKLPMSFPKQLSDCGAHKLGEYPSKNGEVRYNEDIFVGYRYYDTYGVTPQFAFGHGLSYTQFNISGLSLKKIGKQVMASVTIRNTGTMAGAEVIQLYVNEVKPVVKRPTKELKAFEKVFLAPGQQKQVQLLLPAEAFEYYSEPHKKFVHQPGQYWILAGNSSDKITAKAAIQL